MTFDNNDSATIPYFADLPAVPGSEERHAWDVWGRNDELGTINFVTADSLRTAAACVRDGKVISLSAAVNDTDPGLFPHRRRAEHVMVSTRRGRDDHLDSFYPQFGSQWDGLRHIKYHSHGYWGGRSDNDIDSSDTLGIHHWAERGIFARGVLLDVIGYRHKIGKPFRPQESFAISADLLDEVAQSQGNHLAPGDIVVVRTGWMGWYLAQSAEERMRWHGKVGANEHPFACPGLESSRDTVAWLWNHRIAAIVADNPAIEVMPVSRRAGFLHYRLIPLLGMPLGEMWMLDLLANYCERSGHYEFLLSGGVLKVRGGVGSPASAYALL